ncbi:MAG TPA: hypothetical protein VJ302_15525 [Blastocatellia bacterium]|nr:hypothetical protein [Blastocatellia bacterium]
MIEIDRFPAAGADDAVISEEILRIATARALTHHGREAFEKIVSIGDGLWDATTAVRLGIPFLGIGSGHRAQRLREAGANQVLEDYRDHGRFMQDLEEAEIPRSG